MMDYLLQEVAGALRRVEYNLALLGAGGDKWGKDPQRPDKPADGDFLVKKATYDLLREVWHLRDGIRELINERWRQHVGPDKGNGPGPGHDLTEKHLQSSKEIQLCRDLANLSKHYKLTRGTHTGDKPKFGGWQNHLVEEEVEFGGGEEIQFGGGKPIEQRPEWRKPARISMFVIDRDGCTIGDATVIAMRARDAWIDLLAREGFTINRRQQGPTITYGPGE